MNDILGIKPYGEALEHAVKEAFKGVEAFLSMTCKPALEEVGLMLKDKVRIWRLHNVIKIMEKAHGKLEYDGNNINISVNPKVALAIVENSSNEDNDELQEMWAGLFVSSLSSGEPNDENLIYVNILKQLTVVEAKFIRYISENTNLRENEARHYFTPCGILLKECNKILGISDRYLTENILLHLISLNLIKNQTNSTSDVFAAGPKVPQTTDENALYIRFYVTNLGMQLYLKCIGYKGTIRDYFSDKTV